MSAALMTCAVKRSAVKKPRQYIAPVLVAMEQKLRTAQGRRRYLRRQASVEPVVGIIKRVLGFEQFSLRRLQKVTLEWNLVCVAYNLKRLHKLLNPPQQRPKPPKEPLPTLAAALPLLSQLWESLLSGLLNEILRAAELEEPVEAASGFQIRSASYPSARPSNPTGSQGFNPGFTSSLRVHPEGVSD